VERDPELERPAGDPASGELTSRQLGMRPPAWFLGAFEQVAPIAARPHPPTGFRAAAALGRIAGRMGLYGPPASDIARLMPEASPELCTVSARQIAANLFRNRALIAVIRRHGPESAARWTVWQGGADEIRERGRTGRPAVLVTWHVGAAVGIGAALQGLGARVLFIRQGPFFPSTSTVEVMSNAGSTEERALVLRRALSWLHDGGQVVAALDAGAEPHSAVVPCLGRGITLSRGLLALARLAQAPLIPTVARWQPDGTISARAYPALAWPECAPAAVADFERRLAEEAARWLEAYLRQEPGEVWPSTLRWLLDSPRLQ
jgi:lauroyl/myristoyl acyltransferase